MITLEPIAFVQNTRTTLADDAWGAVISQLTVLDAFDESALSGIEEFSHVEILFCFDRVAPEQVERGARHPRGNAAWPRVGIFAQRAKDRPNRLGATIASVVRRVGRTLVVAGLDAVDGTPVVDIKPVMREFLPRGAVRQPAWADELMAAYWGEEA